MQILADNTAGWTRNPINNDESNPWVNLWRVNTSKQSYEKLSSNDVTIGTIRILREQALLIGI
jgi:hypothetical protein